MAEFGSFTRSVKGFVTRTKANAETVWREAVKEVVEQAQLPRGAGGNMPVKTGYLRASIRASRSGVPSPIPGSRPLPSTTYSYRRSQVHGIIDRTEYGNTIYIGWTAEYAEIQEHRTGFMRLAAQNWQSIVKRIAAEHKR